MALTRYTAEHPLVIGEANDAKPRHVRAKASRWFMRAGDHAYVTGDGVKDAIDENWIEPLGKSDADAPVVDAGSDPILVDETPPDVLPAPSVDDQYDDATVATDDADDDGEVIPDELLPYFDDDGHLIASLDGKVGEVVKAIGDDPLKARAVRLAGEDRKTVTRHIAVVLSEPDGD